MQQVQGAKFPAGYVTYNAIRYFGEDDAIPDRDRRLSEGQIGPVLPSHPLAQANRGVELGLNPFLDLERPLKASVAQRV